MRVGVDYKRKRGLKKGANTTVVVLLALAAGAAWMVQSAVPDGQTAADINWSFALVVSLLAGAVRVAVNYIKVVQPDIIPEKLLSLLLKLFVVTLCILPLASCARSAANFDANITTTYDAEGNVVATTDRTQFRQSNIVTWGSELQEGAGEMQYSWEEGKGNMAVGNAANGLTAGNMNELFTNMFSVLLQGYVAKVNEPPSEKWYERVVEKLVDKLGDRILSDEDFLERLSR